jgi:hypothetical protein
MDDSFYTLYTYAIQDKYRQSNGKMNTNLLLQAGRLENESNQMVILAVNLGLRNRWPISAYQPAISGIGAGHRTKGRF